LPGQLTVLSGANGNQVLYNGHPLYTYSKDGDAGNALGQGVGGKWFVATPDLAAMAASTPSY
jgi:predicted lipoprotein with Yx(FWY)xxD motif